MESFVENSSLESSVKNLVHSQTQNVIELEFLVGEESVPVHSSEEGGAFEQSSGVFFLESKEFSGSLSELGEGEMASPYFSFVFETILADQLKFVIDSFLFEGSSGSIEGGGI